MGYTTMTDELKHRIIYGAVALVAAIVVAIAIIMLLNGAM